MLGDFTYCNPTRLHFGKNAMSALTEELAKYGQTVQLIYGGGSIKRNGIYDQVIAALEAAGKTVVEGAGVMPNPTADKLREGVKIAREHNVDFLLAVGGGSCADYAKAVSVSVNCADDPWEKYFARFEEPTCEIIPVGVVLTMAGTGSEMNGGSVITNHEQNLKIGHVFSTDVAPRFAIMNPEFTYSLPKYQTVAGIFDIMNHITEQYFSGTDDNTSDYIMEGLMRGLVKASRAAVANPEDYEARSNIMWTATWALNTFVGCGKAQDWEVHMLGQAVSAVTDATHGMTLAAVALPYYRYIMDAGLPKFARFAQNVWGIDAAGKADEQLAAAGLDAMEAWMREIGCVMNLTELGCDESMLEQLADATFVMEGGYRKLTREEIIAIFRESL
ncbi:iron-containing alcohol dehydrogenase [uncultured Senegalimassilia sp.]|uniref:iron-containing alcohol dehydrogenase n=1 Tax=uncultured Senegalimassilia sp. TaxID=1714350 RepID=UPI00267338FD|nr:iron-containing alcohol dehydrogenase [uncultured Senegalimassilia sp.]